jgi:hypothetical protein
MRHESNPARSPISQSDRLLPIIPWNVQSFHSRDSALACSILATGMAVAARNWIAFTVFQLRFSLVDTARLTLSDLTSNVRPEEWRSDHGA